MKQIKCNWCGQKHAQPSKSALQALATCCKVPDMRATVKLIETSRDDDGTIVLAVVPHDR